MPREVVSEAASGNIAVFAGAGISTETPAVYPWSFYDDIKGQIGLKDTEAAPFPKVMSCFVKRPNGRRLLLQQIRDRVEYVRSFPELYGTATRFHREVSTLPHLSTIITTNWDDFFEAEAGAIPFVTKEDFALSDLPGRKVFKIHGSITNLGSIVVTETDYEKCYRRLRDGVLGATIKSVLAAKTVVYVGYSFRDEDFRRIHKYLAHEMGDLLPHAYVVTPGSSGRLSPDGRISHIATDARLFFSVLKEHLVAQGKMLPDETFARVDRVLDDVMADHMRLSERVKLHRFPLAVFAFSYQDGLMHALKRIRSKKKTGEYSCLSRLADLASTYTDLKVQKRRARKYFDVAYIEGYLNGILSLLAPDVARQRMPRYYVPGLKEQPVRFAAYMRALKEHENSHRAALRAAERILARLPEDCLPQHTHFLL